MTSSSLMKLGWENLEKFVFVHANMNIIYDKVTNLF